ncbi:MAG: ThuA domain-containing protein [Lentisphaeria bacterium]|nr:ThuA domain-containing protein [Lentisphaeria bacterium]
MSARPSPVPEARPCVVCWSENTAPKNVYPADINHALAEGLREAFPSGEIVVGSLEDADQGLPLALLERCRVLVWWGHQRHGQVQDALVAGILRRVRDEGMGFVSLHSAHFAKPNIALMSVNPTSPELLAKVRPGGRVAAWGAYVGDSLDLTVRVADASHPIAAGVPPCFTIPHHERYSDPYAVPPPESVVFTGDARLKDGSVDTSAVGFCWTIGRGRMFYFQAGHETDPVFYDTNVRRILANAVTWAMPRP